MVFGKGMGERENMKQSRVFSIALVYTFSLRFKALLLHLQKSLNIARQRSFQMFNN
jgi:hypothetical protein